MHAPAARAVHPATALLAGPVLAQPQQANVNLDYNPQQNGVASCVPTSRPVEQGTSPTRLPEVLAATDGRSGTITSAIV